MNVSRISELINADHPIVAMCSHYVEDEVGANKACTAGYDDCHSSISLTRNSSLAVSTEFTPVLSLTGANSLLRSTSYVKQSSCNFTISNVSVSKLIRIRSFWLDIFVRNRHIRNLFLNATQCSGSLTDSIWFNLSTRNR